MALGESPGNHITIPPLPAGFLQSLQREPVTQSKGRFQIGIGRTFDEPSAVPHNASLWERRPDGALSWSLQLNVPGALGLRIHLEDLNLPSGGRIFICGAKDPTTPLQTINRAGPGASRDVWTDAQFGEQLLIRCEVPSQADVTGLSMTIRELSQIFRLPSLKSLKDGACENDVTCYPEWAQVASGVARMMFIDQGQTYVCTGCLIATTEPTTKDYFLTARHCITSAKVASTIEFYWLYQTATCNGNPPSTESVPHTAGGAEVVASGLPSDFAFLRLKQAAPSQAFHVLWSTAAPANGSPVVTIHHPSGSYKCISFGNSIGSDGYFWDVQWSSGVTEHGSSGSPLFNANHEFIGQLTGGFNGPGSSCDNPSSPDEYGRFDVTYDSIKAWIGNGFTSNGFIPAKAAFNGLFSVAGDEADPVSSGAFSLRTTAKGAFSGQFQAASGRFSFTGGLDANGAGRAHIMRGQLPAWDIHFQIEPTQQDSVAGTVTDGGWTADLRGNRVVFDGKSMLAPQQGKYTLVISGDPNSSTDPGGDSFGTVKIDRAGRVRAIGSLAEGTKFTEMSVISGAGEWPFFISPYGGHGCLVGWLVVRASDAQDIAGQVNWSKAPLPAKFYPGGFVINRQVSGSLYSPPPKSTPVLSLSNPYVSFQGGGLSQSFSDQITIDANNRVADLSGNKLALTFKTADGTFAGRVTDPQTGNTRNFGGVVLQKQKSGAGYFSGDSQTGRVAIGQ